MNLVLKHLITLTFTLSLSNCQSTKVVDYQQNAKQTKIQLAMNHLNQGRPESAVQVLRPLLQRSQKDSNVLSLMGLSFMALDQPKTAIEHLSKAHRLAPTPTTALNYSSALIESGRNAKAYNLLLKAKKLKEFGNYQFPERIHHNLGLAAEKLKRTSLAEKHYRRAIAKNPSFYLTLMQLAALKQTQNHSLAAQRYLGQARRVCLNCIDPVSQLTQSYLKEGKDLQARRLLTSYLRRTDLEANSKLQASALLQSLPETKQRSAKAARRPRSGR